MDNQCARHQKQGDHDDLRSRLIKEKREQRRQCGTDQTAPLLRSPRGRSERNSADTRFRQRTAAQLFIRRDAKLGSAIRSKNRMIATIYFAGDCFQDLRKIAINEIPITTP